MNKSIERILGRIESAFNILDFSYIVTGGIAYIILYCLLVNLPEDTMPMPTNMPSIFVILGSILFVYSLGILVNSAGSVLREILKKIPKMYFDLHEEWKKLINIINNSADITINDNNGTDIQTIYSYLWICIYSNDKAMKRIDIIHKYWVMQKICEGIFFDCILACVVLIILCILGLLPICIIVTVTIALLLFAYIFACKASLLALTQFREVVITYFHFEYEIKLFDVQQKKQDESEKAPKDR